METAMAKSRNLRLGAVISTLMLFTACDQLAAKSKYPDQNLSPYAIDVFATSVLLNPDDEDDDQIGELVYRGGVEITSSDKRFGGLSGLIVSSDGETFLAVSDKGHWVRGSLGYEGEELSNVFNVELAPLLDPDGASVTDKVWADAEALTGRIDGKVLVAFERNHRVWAFDLAVNSFAARPSPVAMPASVLQIPSNGGLEAVATLDNGTTIIAFSERGLTDQGHILGWLHGTEISEELSLAANEPYNPTDLARLPSGDLLVLERRFSLVGGVGMALRRIKADNIQSQSVIEAEMLAELSAPYTVDNMEGMAVRQTQDGRTLIYVVSDDNYNPLQRTLLMMFELNDQS